MLTITEIWPTQQNSLIRTIKITFFFICCIIFDVTLFDELQNLLELQDYQALAMHLSTFSLYIGFSIKIILFQFTKIEPMGSMLRSIEDPIFDEYPPALEKYKTKCVRISNGVALFYFSSVAISILVYLLKPLYTEYTLPITFSHELSFVTHYALYFLQSFCCYYLVMIGISYDLIVIGLINIATTQLDILREQITNFKPEHQSEKLMEDEEYKFFSRCIQKHEAILKYVGETEDVFTLIFLAQCLITIFAFCNGLFQLAHNGELFSIEFYFNCSFTFDVLFEMGVPCWFATLLTNKSVEVSDACYNYNWLHSSTKVKKLLLIIQCRGQRPLYITAGKITHLSLQAYLQVLKSGYSYFALMQTLYQQKNQW
ncbi:hypothetical protein ABEB36_012068 [Hypothenemus hampei]|uniref:Odorant receptor n=1 Tax=Hypothenemus hampei TaxID=57062 RepID=A0ABD1EA90_HYPHA